MFRKQVITTNFENMDTAVKSSLLLRLKECVNEIVMKYTSDNWVPLKNEEATNMLCWILEAVFIHGLKNTFIKSLFSTRRENSIPNPSFWDFVMIFSHRNIIEQIRKLNYVNTDVGRSRAWIRLTLNEMSLISYLENMFRNPSYVRSFYKPSAFLRDSDKCDILKNYLVGVVESCKFDLVIDNSLLNQWTSGPLALVGLWVDDNISQGIDVAQNMDSKDLQAIPTLGKSKTPEPEFISILRRQPLLGEEDAFRVLMASKGASSAINVTPVSSSRLNSDHSPSQSIVIGSYPSASASTNLSNLNTTTENTSRGALKQNSEINVPNLSVLKPKLTTEENIPNVVIAVEKSTPLTSVQSNSSFSNNPFENNDDVQSTVDDTTLNTENIDVHANNEIDDEEADLTYAELLSVYKNSENKVGAEFYGGSPKEAEMTTTSTDEVTILERTISSTELQEASNFEDGFEIISKYLSKPNKKLAEMLPNLTKYSGKIANEIGMDLQNYACKLCRAPIGMIFTAQRLCHFTGYYFCPNCHNEDLSVIPSRVLLNWDFTKYPVCKMSFDFLEEITNQPLFHLDNINPKLYTYMPDLTELRDLRIKLNYVSMYLKTCKDQSVFEEFKTEIWPRTHFFENVHLYSLTDLMNVTNRSLTSPLFKLLKFGKCHILSCKICKAKGFVCEICRNPEVIFPFNLESIFKCQSCGAVYHDKCLTTSKPCPRCDRWKNTLVLDDDDGDKKIFDDDDSS